MIPKGNEEGTKRPTIELMQRKLLQFGHIHPGNICAVLWRMFSTMGDIISTVVDTKCFRRQKGDQETL